MNKADRLKISWFAVISITVALFALVLATFAWFQHNRNVDTGKATAKSGNESVILELSSRGGSSFSPEEAVAITQVNSADKTELMPVSTADLKTFVTNRHTDGGIAGNFSVVRNEDSIYHGRIYMRAKTGGDSGNLRMDLYLDRTGDSGGNLVKAEQNLLNASRLGLIISGDGKESGTIFYLSDKNNPAGEQVYNTKINGQILGSGKVLDGSSGTIKAADDPALPADSRAVSESGGGYTLPEKPLMTMEMNKIYQADVYFYLEGCDPDCSDAAAFDASSMHLAFFGTVRE